MKTHIALGLLLTAAAFTPAATAQITVTSATQLTGALGPANYPISLSGGGSGAYAVALISGSLPPGLALRSSNFPPGWNSATAQWGLIGVQTAAGTYPFTLQISSGGSSIVKAYTVSVASALDTTPTAVPDAVVGSAYSYQLTAASTLPSPTYSWSLASGNPAGLNISSAGVISGTPAAAGSFTFTTSVTDGAATVATATHTIVVRSYAITSPAALPTATQGQTYNFQLAADANANTPVTWFQVYGNLPPGITISSGGLLSGAPTAYGNYRFAVLSRDSTFQLNQKTFIIQVFPSGGPQLITPGGELLSRMADATIGLYIAHEIWASNGVAPYTYALHSGSQLPPGVSLRTGSNLPNAITSNPYEAVIAGTPTTLGTYTFTIDITDSSATPVTTSETYTIVVSPLYTITNPPTAREGVAYTFAMFISGGTGPYTITYPSGFPPFAFTGQVRTPRGFTFTPATGSLSGTATESGSFFLPVQIADSGNATLSQALAVNVSSSSGSPLGFCSSTNLPSATTGINYSYQLCLQGATSYTFTFLSGAPPSNLSISSSGLITGVPASPGTTSFLVRIADQAASSHYVDVYLTMIVQPLSQTQSSALPAATANFNYTQTLTAGGSDPSLQVTLEPDSILPAGLQLSSAGVLSGKPTVPGFYSFNIRFTTTTGGSLVQNYTLAVSTTPTNATTTTPASLSTAFSASAHPVTLSATVVSAAGTVNFGTITFTVLDSGSNPVGSPVTSATVSNGATSVSYQLPANAAAGTYTVQAAYSGGGPFLASSGSATLTVLGQPSVTSVPSASAPFSPASQNLPVSATVTSGGTVNGGIVTFTLLDSSNNTVGVPVSASVTNGSASTTYNLPAGQARGTYTLQASYSGSGNFAASSGSGVVTISAAPTTTQGSSATAPFSSAIQTVSLSGQVTSAAGAVNGGTLTFTVVDGSNATVGAPVTSAAVANGAATVNYSLPAGQAPNTYTVRLAYSGAGNFASSTGSGSLTIGTATTTTSVAQVTSTYSGSATNLNLSATISAGSGQVSGGTVQFTIKDSGNNVIGSPVTSGAVANGVASVQYQLPAGQSAGSYSVLATYSGTSTYQTSNGTGNLTISGVSATIVVNAASISYSASAQNVNLSATLTSGAGTVNGGTVLFTVRDSQNATVGSPVTSAAVSGGAASVTYAIPAGQVPGSYTIQASYSSGANFAATSGSASLAISGAASTTTVTPASATYSASAQTLNLQASITGGSGTVNSGTVTFSVIDASNHAVGSPVVSSTVASGAASAGFSLPAGTAAGQYTIQASYSGGGNYLASSNTGSLTVGGAATSSAVPSNTISFSASSQNVPLSANITSPAGTVNSGNVTFSLVDSSNNPIGAPATSATGAVASGFASVNWTLPAGLAPGSYTIKANYGNGANFTASSGSGLLTVSAATTVLSVSPASTGFNSASRTTTLLATVTSSLGVVNAGTVTFTVKDGSNNTVGSAATSNPLTSGAASVAYTLPAGLAVGSYTIQASYSGSGSFSTASNTGPLAITAASTSLTVASAAATFSSSTQSIPLSATLASAAGTVSGGSVTFTITDSGNNVVVTVPGVAIAGGIASTNATLPANQTTGTYTITAAYSGSANFASSTGSGTLSITGYTTTLTATAAQTAWSPGQQSVTLTANVSSSGGTVNAGYVRFAVIDSTSNAVGAPIGSSTVVNGAASVSYPLPAAQAPGSYTIQATYIAAVPFGTSANTAVLTITGAASAVSLTAAASPITLGVSTTLTATVTPFPATGKVTFYDGVLPIGTTTVSSGSATLVTDRLSAGAHALSARYSGDAVYNPSLSSAISRTVAANPAGSLLPAPSSPFAAGSAPAAIATGDFDHDGFIDMAVAASNGVYILLGNGSGGIKSTIGPIAAGTYPIAIATADFNGDGNLDLAVANFTSRNVTILLGSGNGNFAPPAGGGTLTAGTGPVAVGILDFNGDGKPDLAILNQGSNNVMLFLGDGQGGFSTFGSPLATGNSPQSLAVGDFNGDGIADLATANTSDGTVSIMIGGAYGSFSAGAPVSAGTSPYFVAIGDFNGDGKQDLAVVNYISAGQVTVLLGAGNGTFSNAPGSPVAVGTSPYRLAIGDFDGDGKLDLAVANSTSNNLSILLGQGDGSFQQRAGSPIAVGNSPQSPVVLDFNSDGIADVAVTTTSGIILLNGALAATTTNPTGTSATFSASQQSVTISATVTSNYGVVNGGTVTFTLRDSSNTVVGTPVTSPAVANGSTSASYILPGGLSPASYSLTAVYSGGGTFSTSTGTSSLVVANTNTVTIASIPSGLSVVVDGVTVTTPAVYQNWTPGSQHTVSATTNPQQTGSQYAFSGWSQGGSATQTITAPAAAATYTATYQLQYFLTTTVVGDGTVTPASGWINANSAVQVTATANSGSTFVGFSGALTGSVNPQSINMTGPLSVSASFAAGSASLSAAINSKVDGTLASERVWTVALTNNGTAPATNAQITQVKIGTITGSATVTLSPQMTLPVTAGPIASGAVGYAQIRLIFPATTPASRISITLTYSPDGGVTTTQQTFNSQFR